MSPPRRRLGVQFADGRRASADQFRLHFPLEEQQLQPPVMHRNNGSDNDNDWRQDFWVWGLPAQGPVTLVYDCQAENLPETRLALDGDLLRSAAANAQALWRWEE